MQPAKTALMTAALLIAISIPAAPADHQMKLTGNFMSGYQDRVKPLRAVFTPTEDRGEESERPSYDVVFYFNFNGQNHEYRGNALGSLSDGELEGQVKSDTGQRKFTFKGAFEEGVFKGTHAEIGRRGERKTGTLTLKG